MAPTTFTATATFASSAEEAAHKVERRLVPGFALTGRVAEKSARHMLWDVEVEDLGGDADALWVELTSYGIDPGAELGSSWQLVPGVGLF